MEISELQNSFQDNDHDRVSEIIHKLLFNSRNKEDIITLKIYKLLNLLSIGKIDESRIILDSLKENINNCSIFNNIYFDLSKAWIKHVENDNETSIIICNEILSNYNYKDLNDKKIYGLISQVNLLLAKNHEYLDIDRYKKYLVTSLENAKLSDNSIYCVNNYLFLSEMDIYKGKLDRALINLDYSLKICNKLKLKKSKSRTYDGFGMVNWMKADYSSSLFYFQKSYEILRNNGQQRSLPNSLTNVGAVYYIKGDYLTASKYHLESIKIAEEFDITSIIANSYSNLGETLMLLNQDDKALLYLNKAQVIYKNTPNPYNQADTLYILIKVHLNRNEIKQAEMMYEDLNKLDTKGNNKLIQSRLKFCSALILIKKNRRISKADGERILLEMINNPDEYDDQVITNVSISLLDLLVQEYETSKIDEILSEINEILNKMYIRADKLNNQILKLKLNLYRIKYLLFLNNNTDAFNLINESILVAQENNDFNTSKYLLSCLENAEDKIDQKLSADNISLSQSFKSENFNSNHRLIANIENPSRNIEVPIQIRVINSKGNILTKRDFIFDFKLDKFIDTISYGLLKNPNLNLNSLNRYQFLNTTILSRDVDGLLLLYAFNGSSFSGLQKLDSISTLLKPLKQFNIDDSNVIKTEYLSSQFESYISDLFDEKKEMKDYNLKLFPKEVLQYKTLLSPVRLSVLKMLYHNYKLGLAEIREILGVSWGAFKNQIKKLEELELIESFDEFIDEQPRVSLYMTSRGFYEYRELSNILKSLVL